MCGLALVGGGGGGGDRSELAGIYVRGSLSMLQAIDILKQRQHFKQVFVVFGEERQELAGRTAAGKNCKQTATRYDFLEKCIHFRVFYEEANEIDINPPSIKKNSLRLC